MRFGVALASAVSQVGCVTVVVILGALVAGMALDKALDTQPVFTLLLVIGSIPVSLYLLVRIALSATAQLTAPPSQKEAEEESSEKEE
jgi:hypothetical protein